MKNLKIGFMLLCGLMFAFGSCKKKDDTPAPNNSFVIGNSNYAANIGFYATYGTSETDLLFFNKLLTSGATGINSVIITFGGATIPAAGTYTYTKGILDVQKNFSAVGATYNSFYDATSGDIKGGTTYDSTDGYDATGSTITVSKNGDTYTIVYNLKFTDSSNKTTIINGQFSGSLTKSN